MYMQNTKVQTTNLIKFWFCLHIIIFVHVYVHAYLIYHLLVVYMSCIILELSYYNQLYNCVGVWDSVC